MTDLAFLPFEFAKKNFLIDALLVREILGKVQSLVVPQANRELPGVFLWNSQATPRLDLASCLNLQDADSLEGGCVRTLVVQVDKETLGFGVDEVGEVVKVAKENLNDVRIHSLPFALAEVEIREEIFTVLDLPKLAARALGLKSLDSEVPLR